MHRNEEGGENMAIRQIREEGDEILKKKSREVEEIDDKIRELLDDMVETMHINIPNEDICITKELKGDNWWFRVSDTVHENFL